MLTSEEFRLRFPALSEMTYLASCSQGALSDTLATALLEFQHTMLRHGAPWPVWLMAAVPCAVGCSRLYRGMHHPSDVLAGALLGVLCVVLANRVVLAGHPPEVSSRGRR